MIDVYLYLYVKLNWDANLFLPAESKDCMNSVFVWVQKYVGCERGRVCAHRNADYLLENLSCKDHESHGGYRPSLFLHGGMLISSIFHGVVRFNIKHPIGKRQGKTMSRFMRYLLKHNI